MVCLQSWYWLQSQFWHQHLEVAIKKSESFFRRFDISSLIKMHIKKNPEVKVAFLRDVEHTYWVILENIYCSFVYEQYITPCCKFWSVWIPIILVRCQIRSITCIRILPWSEQKIPINCYLLMKTCVVYSFHRFKNHLRFFKTVYERTIKCFSLHKKNPEPDPSCSQIRIWIIFIQIRNTGICRCAMRRTICMYSTMLYV